MSPAPAGRKARAGILPLLFPGGVHEIDVAVVAVPRLLLFVSLHRPRGRQRLEFRRRSRRRHHRRQGALHGADPRPGAPGMGRRWQVRRQCVVDGGESSPARSEIFQTTGAARSGNSHRRIDHFLQRKRRETRQGKSLGHLPRRRQDAAGLVPGAREQRQPARHHPHPGHDRRGRELQSRERAQAGRAGGGAHLARRLVGHRRYAAPAVRQLGMALGDAASGARGTGSLSVLLRPRLPPRAGRLHRHRRPHRSATQVRLRLLVLEILGRTPIKS